MSKITLYVGAPIEYDSELQAFRTMHEIIMKMNVETVIIANANIETAQIDLIVAFGNQAYVFEVKGSRCEIRGAENGTWQRKNAAGSWSVLPNYYEQALRGSYIVKNALKAILQKEVGYLKGTLLFVPGLQPGSQVPHDFKVSAWSLSDLDDLSASGDTKCSIADWKKFAVHYKLQKLSNVDAATNRSIFEMEKLMQHYNTSFINYYKKDAADFVPVNCRMEEHSFSSDEIPDFLPAGDSFHLSGHSGCGKTLLAKQLAVQLAGEGNVVAYLAAQYFTHSFNDFLKDEISLFGITSVGDFFSKTAKLGKQVIIIIDGFNECRPDAKERLVRTTIALCNRHELKIIIVSQGNDIQLGKLKLAQIEILPPSDEIKKTIAAQHARSESIPFLQDMIGVVKTGLEANVIGIMGMNSLQKKSRFALLEHFARIQLADHASPGLRCLTGLAAYLEEKISYSISLRQLDDIIAEYNLDPRIKKILLSLNLLQQNFDRIAFAHELFMNTFIAAGIVAGNDHNSAALIREITAPKNHDKRELILGAIQDDQTLENVLRQIDSSNLILSLTEGTAGEFAKLWVHRRFLELIVKIRSETENLEFEIIENEAWPVRVKETSLLHWSSHEKALMGALPELLGKGEFINEMFEVIPLADRAIISFLHNPENGNSQYRRSLTDHVFQAAYIRLFAGEHALCNLFSIIDSGFFGMKFNHGEGDKLFKKLRMPDQLSFGQVHFLLGLNRFNRGIEILYPSIVKLVSSDWNAVPYHLQLRLMEAVKYYHSDPQKKNELLPILNNLLEHSSEQDFAVSSTIFEAYQALGGTDKDELAHEHTVRLELERIFTESNDENKFQGAFSLYYMQFDHPYGAAYWNVLTSLDPEKRKEFMIMAVQGTEGGMFTMSAILDTAKLCGPSSAVFFEKFKKVPPEQSTFPQDDTSIFYLTHLLLARFAYPLASSLGNYTTLRDKILCASAEIFYWINRNDLELELRKQACSGAWVYLLQTKSMLVTEGLWLSRQSLRNYDYSGGFNEPPVILIGEIFPEKIIESCRISLTDGTFTTGIFRWDKKEDMLRNAISMLGEYGTVLEVSLLKSFIHDQHVGIAAVEAIKRINR